MFIDSLVFAEVSNYVGAAGVLLDQSRMLDHFAWDCLTFLKVHHLGIGN